LNTLDVIGVSKTFGRSPVLSDVSFNVAHGEIVALLGPSGCGKTTTLRLVAGFESLDQGTIRIAGVDVVGRQPYERDFGMVFQDYALFPHRTVRQNLAYGLHHRGYAGGTQAGRIEEMLDLVRLGDLGERYPSQLSGGQKQRIALARALAPNPAILLLDEPLSALDATIRVALRSELRQLLKAVHTTTLIVTHDQEEAMAIADRVIVMHHGVVVQQGAPLDVYRRPQCRFVADFFGTCNWLRGTVQPSPNPNNTRIVGLRGGQSLQLTGPCPDGDVDVGIRPERIRIATGNGTNNDRTTNELQARVTDVSDFGSRLVLTTDVGGGESLQISTVHDRDLVIAVGMELRIVIDSDDLIIC